MTSSQIVAAALDYQRRGWWVTPVAGKAPILEGWQDRQLEESDIRALFRPESNVGVVLGASGLADLDFDDEAAVRALRALAPPELEGAAAFEHNGRPHLIVRSPRTHTRKLRKRNGAVLLELRCEGAQTVFPPSVHPDGQPYVWVRECEPLAVDGERLQVLAAMIATAAYASEFWTEGTRHDLALTLAGGLARQLDEADVLAAVRAAAAVAGDVEVRDREQAVLTTIRRVRSGQPVVGLPTLSDLAPDLGRSLASWWGEEPSGYGGLPGGNGTGPGREMQFPRTDSGNAELFASLYGDRLRYDHRRKRWLVWAGHWWQPDSDGEVIRLAKAAARHRYDRAAGIDNLKGRQAEAQWAVSSESRMRLDAALNLAKNEHPIADAGDRWDADPWLLGVRNSVVDLRTGELRAGRPEDRITQHVEPAYDPSAGCPRWQSFLQEIFGGDAELVDFIWRAVGYSLTGDISEHSVFVCHGAGANGKTTFLGTVRSVIASYGHNMPFSTIEMQGRAAVPTDVADLVGKRLVTATETNERTRLNEARLKALSGGDPVTARHLFGNFFEFRPVAKFWLAVNHRPRVDDDSYGFWRRVRLIPLTRVFRGGEADRSLPRKLMSEAQGILVWAVRGCLERRRRGLEPPDAVRLATDDYQRESDPLAGFIADRCLEAPNCKGHASTLYKAYREWAQEQGLRDWETVSSKEFGRRLGDRFEKGHDRRGNFYRGLGLLDGGCEGSVKGPEYKRPEIHKSSHAQIALAKELENPSHASHGSRAKIEDARAHALQLWQARRCPEVRLDGFRRITDVKRFLARASDEDVAAFVAALERRG